MLCGVVRLCLAYFCTKYCDLYAVYFCMWCLISISVGYVVVSIMEVMVDLK